MSVESAVASYEQTEGLPQLVRQSINELMEKQAGLERANKVLRKTVLVLSLILVLIGSITFLVNNARKSAVVSEDALKVKAEQLQEEIFILKLKVDVAERGLEAPKATP